MNVISIYWRVYTLLCFIVCTYICMQTEKKAYKKGYFPFSDINECDSNPCINGGTCVDKIISYQCDCVPGYTGTNCETGNA